MNFGMECDGVRWIYNTTEQWLEQFPFWSESTLKRAFASLKTLGLLRCEKLNKSKRDMTNFYTINYGSELLDLSLIHIYEPAYLPVARLEDGTLWNW